MASSDLPAGISVSYRRQYRRCGRPRCPTCGAPGALGHGPYWYAYWWQDGRMRSRYVGKHPPAAATPAAAPAPRALRARTLGAFAVWRGEEAIPAERWGRRKVALLFKGLLSAPGYRLPREQLLEWLWPGAEPGVATRNLHSTLHRLRRLLDTPAGSGSHVRLEGEVVALLPAVGEGASDDWLDASAFAHAAGVALAGRDMAACRAALARYEGEYLPEEPYEEWAVARREELRAQHLALLEHLARLSLAAGGREEAERCLRALLAREPSHERAARRLMRLLAEAGRRAEALRVYQALAAGLREELDVAPDGQTEALRAALLAQDSAPRAAGAGVPSTDRSLPGGTLTFLATEIEGGAALPERRPAAADNALRRYQALLASTIAPHHGMLPGRQGEGGSALIAFTSPTAALAAACALQQALLAEAWLEDLRQRVRMALHSGEARPHRGTYVGAAVTRCDRLRALAHGGQILLSQAAADLVRDSLPEGVGLRPLGVYQLRGLERAELVYQVLHPRLPADFPPLPSPDTRRGNLPAPLSGLIGREDAVAEVRGLLGTARLLTLTGVGGIGKTRLALQVAGQLEGVYPDGIWLVELAPLGEPALVPQAVARALGLREDGGTVPGRPLLDTLADYLRDKELLLVLDNCEHLVAACAEAAATLLRACPRLRILATSREVLGVEGEVVWRVPPLATPGEALTPDTDLGSYPAVQLFVARAQGARPGFRLTAANGAAVTAICRRLDGLPLAIELAAARVGVLPVEGIAARLDDRFRILAGGSRTAPARQQTLRATMDWSFGLLSEAERMLLWRLAVFAGGWTLEAAEAVCAGEGLDEVAVLDLLARLVTKSLVQAGEQGEGVRYSLLETVRAYGLEQLAAAGEEAPQRERHLAWCLALAERAEPQLTGPEQTAWLARLEAEHDNLRVALAWCSAARDRAERGLRLGVALWRSWLIHGYLTEGLRWLEGLLSLAAPVPPALQAKALGATGNMLRELGDYQRATALFEAVLALRRELGDTDGEGGALSNLGRVAHLQGDYPRAATLHAQSLALFRQEGATWGVALALYNVGLAAEYLGDYEAARSSYEESLALYRQLGDRWGMAIALHGLADVQRREGRYEEAARLYEETLALRQAIGVKHHIAHSLAGLGVLAYYQGEHDRALALFEQCLALVRAVGDRWSIASTLLHSSMVVEARGDHAQATALLEESLVLCRQIRHKEMLAQVLNRLGGLARQQGDVTRARALHEESLAISRERQDRAGLAECLGGLALLALTQDQPIRASTLLGAAATLRTAGRMRLPPPEQATLDRAVDALRARSGEDAFARVWAEGQALSLEQAVALALADEAR